MLDNIILALPSLCMFFWFTVLVLNIKKSTRSNKILTILSFFASIFFYIQTTFLTGKINFRLDLIDPFISLSCMPLMCLYFKSLTNNSQFKWNDYLIFMPTFIIGLGTVLLFTIAGEHNILNFYKEYLQNNLSESELIKDPLYKTIYYFCFKTYNLVLILQIISTVIYTNIRVYKYHNKLRNYYSSLEDKSIKLNLYILICANIALIFPLIYILTTRVFWLKYHDYTLIFIFLWTIPYFIWGFLANKIHYSVENFDNDISQNNGYYTEIDNMLINKKEIKICNMDNQLKERLISLMDDDKVFLKSSLRIDDVAQMLCSNRTYISQIINKEYDCNFSEFINKYRVEYSKNIIFSNPEISIDELIIECGFISTSSFYRVFKKHIGCTPKEWLKSIKT